MVEAITHRKEKGAKREDILICVPWKQRAFFSLKGLALSMLTANKKKGKKVLAR